MMMSRDKPNEWITVADLMAGVVAVVMLLFVIAAIQVVHSSQGDAKAASQRRADIDDMMKNVDAELKNTPPARLNGHVVEYGEQETFDNNSSMISQPAADKLRSSVKAILQAVKDTPGARWLKQFVVVGYASSDGSYLHNLDLTLRRGERVLCELISKPPHGGVELTDAQREQVRQQFLVSGFSFNSLKSSAKESRRVEIRFEFWGLNEARTEQSDNGSAKIGVCEVPPDTATHAGLQTANSM